MMIWAPSSGLKKAVTDSVILSRIRTEKQSVLSWWPRMVSLKPAWRAHSLAPIGRINWLVDWKEMGKDSMEQEESKQSRMMSNTSHNTYSTNFDGPLFGHRTLDFDFAAILFQSFNKLSSNSAVMKISSWVRLYKHGWSKIQMSRSKFRKRNRRFLIPVESEQNQSAYKSDTDWMS